MLRYRFAALPAIVVSHGLLGALLMLALPSPASAQRVLYNDPPEVRFFVGGGATYGGDKLASATYDNGRRQNVRAGNMAQVFIGLEWRPTRYFQAALSGGYHTDSASSYNGDVRFSRYPVELLAYYRPDRFWRIGGGLRMAFSPDLTGSGDAAFLSESFDTAYSPVIELEFLPSRHHGIKLRAVRERYESTENLPAARGNHFGLLVAFYF